MNSVRRVLFLLVALAPVGAGASWWEVHERASSFDLPAARAAALRTVAEQPEGAEAVAAAAWWLRYHDNLQDAEAILTAAGSPQDPELAFILARIEGELTVRPPRGVLLPFDLSGPFGAYEVLDIDRHVVPDDAGLPAINTPWQGPGEAFRLALRSATGRASVPNLLYDPGVYLAAWTVDLEQPLRGWLVVEADGHLNLQVNGREVARLRNCGLEEPGIHWYAVDMAKGQHRIRAEFSGLDGADVRVSLLDASGNAAQVQVGHGTDGPWAGATVKPAAPPARHALELGIAGPETTVQQLLLAAELAEMRSDPRAQQQDLETAVVVASEDPWVHLSTAAMYLTQPLGLAPEVAERRAREHLRKSREIPASLIFEHALAVRQKRPEDLDRLLDELMEKYAADPRVLRMWVRESVHRGWAREAEEGMAKLLAMLPESISVLELRLDVLEALERWQERNALLTALASEGDLSPRRIEQLASSCFNERAVAGLRELAERIDDPMLEIGIARLLFESERPDEARDMLGEARTRWGDLRSITQLELVLDPMDQKAMDQALEKALADDPANVELRSLAWRSGAEPFFAPYQVDAMDYAERQPEIEESVDAVVLLDQAVERLFEDGSSMYYYHGLTRTQTPEGARQAALLQQLPNALLLRVRIVKPDGRVIFPAELNSRNGNILLDDVKEGDLVEEEYVAGVPASHPAKAGHISPYIYRFADPERAFGLSEYVLLAPETVALKADGNFGGLQREEWVEDGLRGVRWRATSVAPVPAEPLAPPTQELLPWVTYGFGVSWEDVGDELRDRVLPFLRSSRELEQWSAPLTTGDDAKVVFQRLVEKLFDEVESGQAPLELRMTAGESFSQRRGNRMAILASVLARAGWRVDLLLARPLAFARSHLEVPTMEAFSLPVLRVRRDGEEMWIDFREGLSGINRIDPMLQGSDALLLPLSSPEEAVRLFDPLPSFDNSELEERMWVDARLDGRGWAQLETTTELRGTQAESLEQRINSIPADQVPLFYDQLGSNFYPGAEQVQGEIERSGDTLKLRLHLELPRACTIRDSSMECRDLVPTTPLAPALAALPTRQFPLVLHLPVLQRKELVVHFPPGWSLDRQARRLQAKWGFVDEEIERTDTQFRSVLRLSLPAQTVATDSYREFARFCQAVDELIRRPEQLRR